MLYYNYFKDNKTRKINLAIPAKLTVQHIDFSGLKQIYYILLIFLFRYCYKGFEAELFGFFE